MKTKSKKSLLLAFEVLFLALGLGYSTTSLAQDATTVKHHKHGGFKKFRRGVCVGQTLAQEGIILPKPQPGQRPAWDPATKAAFKAAIQSCRAQFKGPGQGSPAGSGTSS